MYRKKIEKPQIISEIISKWFASKNLKKFSYQENCILQVNDSLFTSGFPTILAACPSAGKTSMSIAYIEFYLAINPNAKILVLTHGTTVLRTQYFQEIKKLNVSFTYKEIQPKQKDFNASVIIAIPQTLDSFKSLPQFDLLIVDEAHQFYFAEGKGKNKGNNGQVKNIIEMIKPKHQLLLSGSPSKFIKKGFPIIPITIEELLKENVITDVVVELATSIYKFKTEDFNNTYSVQDIAAKKVLTKSNTIATMDDLLTYVLKRLTSAVKNNPKAYANLSTVTKIFTGKSWNDALSTLKKTMIACAGVDQADAVYDYLTKKGINCALSHNTNDKDSKEIARFIEKVKDETGNETNEFVNPDCLVLIVVDRGILGFNLPEMENVIDMTCTYNPDMIFQLMGRVLRKHPKGKQKLFFKIVPTGLSNLYRGVMQVVALLSNEKYYTTFDGKNMLDLKLFAEAEIEEKIKIKRKPKPPQPPRPPRPYVPIKFEGVPFFKIFNDLIHQDNEKLAGIIYVTLRQVIDRIKGYHTTIEEVIVELELIHNG
jgi:superfamily II DNA or RNA helicase